MAVKCVDDLGTEGEEKRNSGGQLNEGPWIYKVAFGVMDTEPGTFAGINHLKEVLGKGLPAYSEENR